MAQSLLNQGKSGNQAVFPEHWHIVPPSGHTGGKVPSATERRPLHDDSELAGKLKLTRRTLADYRLNGKIPYYKIGGKLLYKEKDVLALLESNRMEAFDWILYRLCLPDGFFSPCRPPFISYFNSYLQRSPFALHNHGKKAKPGHIRNGNTGFCQAGHV